MEKSQLGTYNEMRVATELIKRGCTVFMPLRPDGEIDLIAIAPDGREHRIQVRTAWGEREGKRQRLRISLTRNALCKTRRFSDMVTDFVAVKDDYFWILPIEIVKGKWKVSLLDYMAHLGEWSLIAGENGVEQEPAAVVRLFD